MLNMHSRRKQLIVTGFFPLTFQMEPQIFLTQREQLLVKRLIFRSQISVVS
jgi:hypothetical protein